MTMAQEGQDAEKEECAGEQLKDGSELPEDVPESNLVAEEQGTEARSIT